MSDIKPWRDEMYWGPCGKCGGIPFSSNRYVVKYVPTSPLGECVEISCLRCGVLMGITETMPPEKALTHKEVDVIYGYS